MGETKEPRWSFSATQIVVGILAVISMTLGTWKAISEKADQKQVDELASIVTELSAKRREDFVMLTNIRDLTAQTNSKITKIEDNQAWQIQQEVKRLQWQSFKPDPASPPPTNVNR